MQKFRHFFTRPKIGLKSDKRQLVLAAPHWRKMSWKMMNQLLCTYSGLVYPTYKAKLVNNLMLICFWAWHDIVHNTFNPNSANQRRKEQLLCCPLSQHPSGRQSQQNLSKSFRKARMLLFNIMLQAAMCLFLKSFNSFRIL